MPTIKTLSGDQSNRHQLESFLQQIGNKANAPGDWSISATYSEDGKSKYVIDLEPVKPVPAPAE